MIVAYAHHEGYHYMVKNAVELMESINNDRYEKINCRIYIDLNLTGSPDYRSASSGARFKNMAYYMAQSRQSERYNYVMLY